MFVPVNVMKREDEWVSYTSANLESSLSAETG
jgi:hypothetical protein